MKTIDEVMDRQGFKIPFGESRLYTAEAVRKMLEEYGKMVVDECASVAKEDYTTDPSDKIKAIKQQIK